MSESKQNIEEKLKDPQFADFVEETATQVVACFRQFMDILRSEFPPIDSLKAANAPVTVKDKPLYTLIVNQGLLKLVEGAVRQAKSLDPEEDEATPRIEDPTERISDERYNLVKEVLSPMVEALTLCYRIIDQLPQPNPPQPQSPRNRNKKPEPPRGMLSIQNYTDIACVLEFLICTSIMPHLDPFVVTPLQDRIRLLPKSIAGRLPKLGLGWAASQPVQRTSLELQQTTQVVARLIFLDRFRPMLLPRHVTDLYAAIFQAEQLETDPIARSLGYQLLYDKLGLTTSSSTIVDPHLQARAYQLLLLQGTRGPKWLRQRVSPLLTALACRDLSAILHVFVPIKEPSMAAQRLGRALSPAASGTQAREFCEQLIQVLQEAYPLADRHHPRQVAMSLTIWAALYQLPPPTLKQQILPLWVYGFFTPERIHPSIRQVGSLASWIPPSTNPGTVLQWLLLSPLSSTPTTDTTSDPGTHSTIIGQLLRIAAMPSILESRTKQDALMTLRWCTKAMCASTVESKQQTDRDKLPPVEGASILSLALVYAMAPSSWDLKGNRYRPGRSGPQKETGLQEVAIEEDQGNSPDVTLIAEDITKRANLLVDEILLVFEQASAADAAVGKSSEAKDQEEDKTRGLPSRLFRLLLGIYLSTTTSSAPSSIMPEALYRHADSFRLVSMILLPLICEKCSPESLLLGDRKDATGVLSMVKLVLVCAKSRLEDSSGKTNETVEEAGIASEIQREDEESKQGNCIFQEILQDDVNMEVETSAPERGADHDESDGTLLSIASIVLSLLIAVLELGSTKRSSKEEEMLVSFHPILKPLAELNASPTSETSSAWSEAGAGMADMASYAMALVASRNAAEEVFDEQKADDRLESQDKMTNMIAQAEQDLQSTQPPLRARGMVSLGRLARGYLGGIQEQEVAKPLVEELDQSGAAKQDPAQFLMHEILRLSTIALKDPESYVYLAAVQTIVAAGDMRPKQVLPVIASAVATGVVHQNSDELATATTLSMEQRIKMAEALMFIIRRRAATDEFVPMLVNCMVFGSSERIGSDDKINGSENGERMQQETHSYFARGVDQKNEWEDETLQEQRQEQDVRLKTGGPLYTTEEPDVVRAARVSVLSELVTMSKPSLMAPFCDLLIRLVTNVLRLESSRPVTRAASLLAKELYSAVLREQEQMTQVMEDILTRSTVSIAMTIAMVSSKEELLWTTLQQQVSASGVSINSSNDRRVYDPATTVRCTEALDLREQAEQGGILAAARLSLSERRKMNASPRILQIVQTDEETPNVIVDKWNAVG